MQMRRSCACLPFSPDRRAYLGEILHYTRDFELSCPRQLFRQVPPMPKLLLFHIPGYRDLLRTCDT
jgi:hypothetical protein